ncbi:MAG: hypothetical protein H7Y43_01880 [Akkermansiaceae bacterium]|nr:hypothetical protein [Verrucomicrobiales bacterium]
MLRAMIRKIGPLLLFILVFAITRIPGMLSQDFANFSAAYALMFCSGVYLARNTAWWLPLAAMLITDIGLNCYYMSRGWDVWDASVLKYQLINYVAYVALIGLGKCFKPGHSFASLLGGGLLGALLFYFITNTASWLFNPFNNPEYTKTFFGWITALIKGTHGWPETWQFFRNTMLSGGLFTGIFVAAMKYSDAAESAQEKNGPSPAEESEGEAKPEEAKA